MKKQTLTIARWIGVLVLYALLSFLLMEILGRNGVYPTGSDTYYHIYRGDYLYHSILEEGNWYPLINQDWYNGVELLRYWAPLTAYAMAFFQYLAGGDLFLGYLFFCGVVFFFGGISWSFIGQKIHRFWMGTFIGILWFFIPNNLYALFIEGNLARSLSMIFLPVFVMYLYRYLEEKRVTDFMGITISFVLMILCHLGYAGMLALATLLFLGIYCVSVKEYVAGVRAVLAILFGFLLTGVWLLPSLGGGIVSMDASETMKLFFQQLSISLNPFIRLTDNRDTFFYFGLSLFLLAVFGPGLYVMAVSFAPELIPVHLLAKLAQGEASTPLPPMPEMLAVTLLLEIVREAGLRAPKSISHTVSLVGALIIGETAVSAGIISVPVLTMAAAATIATLAVPALYEQSILFRFVVILLAGLFGVPGLACGALLILAMACGSDPFGYDYLYPLMPPGKAALRDGFVRAIWSRLAQKGEVLPRHAKE